MAFPCGGLYHFYRRTSGILICKVRPAHRLLYLLIKISFGLLGKGVSSLLEKLQEALPTEAKPIPGPGRVHATVLFGKDSVYMWNWRKSTRAKDKMSYKVSCWFVNESAIVRSSPVVWSSCSGGFTKKKHFADCEIGISGENSSGDLKSRG